MFVELMRNNQVKVIHLNCQHLDASNAEDLFEQAKETIVDAEQVVIDLGGLELIDSSGLGFLLNCYKEIKENGGNLRVVARHKMVLSLFELVYFSNIVDVYESLTNAVNLPQAS